FKKQCIMKSLIIILLLGISNLVLAQNVIYNGEVTDNSSKPIISATVFNKLTGETVKTNQYGLFQIKGSTGDSIRFSAVGYQSQWLELKANSISKIVVVLQHSRVEIDEVSISTGYQSIQKERMTGSYYHVDNDLLNRAVSSNVLD